MEAYFAGGRPIQPGQLIVHVLRLGKGTRAKWRAVGIAARKIHCTRHACEAGNIACKQPQPILQKRAANLETGIHRAVVVRLRDVPVQRRVNPERRARPDRRVGAQTTRGKPEALVVGVETIRSVIGDHRTMPRVGTGLLNYIDDAAAATVFGFEATGFDLNFLAEFHGHVCAYAAILDIGGVHPFNHVGVFGVAGTVNLETSAAASSTLGKNRSGGALERLLARPGSEGDDRLERTSLGMTSRISWVTVTSAL